MQLISLSALRRLGDHNCFRSNDLAESNLYISSLFKPHNLSVIGRNQKLDVQIGGVRADSFSLLYHRHQAGVLVQPENLEDFFLLQIPVSGGGHIVINRRKFDIDPHHAAMISPMNEVKMEFKEGCEQLILRIPRRELEHFLEQELCCSLDTPLQFSSEVRLDASTSHEIVQMLKFVTALFGTNVEDRVGGLVIKSTVPLIFGAVLQGIEHNYSDRLKQEKGKAAPPFLKRAQDYMFERLGNPLTLEEVADAVNVSPRSLHYAFQKHMNTSPMRYLRNLRLGQAHELLLRGKPVSYVALQVGFQHFGHFSAAYRARFGRVPSSTGQLG